MSPITTRNDRALYPWCGTTGRQRVASIFPRRSNSTMSRGKSSAGRWLSAAWKGWLVSWLVGGWSGRVGAVVDIVCLFVATKNIVKSAKFQRPRFIPSKVTPYTNDPSSTGDKWCNPIRQGMQLPCCSKYQSPPLFVEKVDLHFKNSLKRQPPSTSTFF